jgi:hypothetical protein
MSSRDKSDRRLVITAGLQTNAGTRIGTLHIHLNGIFKFFASRFGKENGYQAIIAQAKIPGYTAAEEGDNLEEL